MELFSGVWEYLLSRDFDVIREAYQSIPESQREAIREHLKRMLTEEDWHPEQMKSAEIALAVIASFEAAEEIEGEIE
ncbi:MAG: hypothetical protein JW750_01760 [Anaerolineaceae bacterium]|nr:hypothetical protein [Anaerolineaceae bacterium]